MPLPTFPIIVLDGKTPIPENTMCYIVAKNGTFMQQVTPFCTRIIPVEAISVLQTMEPSVSSKLPMIPALIIARARLFFRRVFYRYRAESVLMMYINDDTGEWELDCPEQQVAYSGIDYKKGLANITKTGRRLQGSIHSHCDFGAGHSSTDTGDEIDFSGLHLTMGHVNQDGFSLVSSFAFHNSRFQVEPRTVVNGLMVSGQEPEPTMGFRYGFRAEPHFTLVLSDEDNKALLERYIDETDDVWMSRVTPRPAGRYCGGVSYGSTPSFNAGGGFFAPAYQQYNKRNRKGRRSHQQQVGQFDGLSWQEPEDPNLLNQIRAAQAKMPSQATPQAGVPEVQVEEFAAGILSADDPPVPDGGDGTGFNPGLVDDPTIPLAIPVSDDMLSLVFPETNVASAETIPTVQGTPVTEKITTALALPPAHPFEDAWEQLKKELETSCGPKTQD